MCSYNIKILKDQFISLDIVDDDNIYVKINDILTIRNNINSYDFDVLYNGKLINTNNSFNSDEIFSILYDIKYFNPKLYEKIKNNIPLIGTIIINNSYEVYGEQYNREQKLNKLLDG